MVGDVTSEADVVQRFRCSVAENDLKGLAKRKGVASVTSTVLDPYIFNASAFAFKALGC